MKEQEIIDQLGEHLTGQLNITWDTAQTLGQFIEIRRDGGEDADNIDIEDFIEYVKSNTADVIQQTLESFGQIGLEKELFVLDNNGFNVDDTL